MIGLWLRSAELLSRRHTRQPLWETRYEWIRRLAPGKSFLDLGGMWGVNGRVAFLAEEAGATRTVVFDGMDPSREFEAEHAARASSVKYVQGDLHDEVGVEELGVFDVVWCTGVLYHTPSPYLQLEHLRRLTGERLVLGTHVIPEIPFLPNGCMFLPGLPRSVREGFAARLPSKAPLLWGLTTEFDYTPGLGYANCWWVMSPSAVKSMLEVAGFEGLEESSDSLYWLDLIAAPIARESVIPPTSFSRKRGQTRLRGYGEGNRPGWA